MTNALEFFLDEHGLPSARGDDERLATYLQTDLQGSLELTSQLIAHLEDPEFTGDVVGNGHCVDFRDNSVSIEAMHDEKAPDRVVSRAEMLEHVKAWHSFIAQFA